MNAKAIEILAKYRVKFEAKCGTIITLEQARIIESHRLSKLEQENDYPY